MWVESKVGRGTSFYFTIMVQAVAKQKQRYRQQAELAGKQILIVDKNETNRRILTHQSQSWGMQPKAVDSGPRALALIQQGIPFDMAILDMQMPDMDGLALAAAIRKHRDAQTLPLIMLTSLGRQQDIVESAYFSAYLTKPLKPAQLHKIALSLVTGDSIPVEQSVSRFEPKTKLQHSLRILLAEDNVVNQKVALHILQKIGIRADVAANGLEVLEALKRQPYDVILMDVQMPELDGVETTQRIRRQWPSNRQPFIIALTANALKGDREKYLATGMDDYASKPIQVDELISALSKCKPLSEPMNRAPTMSDPPQSAPVDPLPEEVINISAIAEFQAVMGEDGVEVVTELIDIFFEDAPTLLAGMRQAIADKDAETFQRAAHTLKSNSATFGAIALSALCEELENIGQAGVIDNTLDKVMRLEEEYQRVKVALQKRYLS